MTILNCSATTCVYNENELCSRGEIEVMGADARRSDETCCGKLPRTQRRCGNQQLQRTLRL